MQNKKVLFISRRFYPDIKGGGQISALHIAKAVSLYGIKLKVLTFTEDKTKEEEIEGIKIIRKNIKKLKFMKKLSNLDIMYWQIMLATIKEIKNFKPDIVHLLNFESIPYTSIIIKKLFPKIKIVTTVNGPNFGCYTGNAIDYNDKTCINCKFKKRFKCSTTKWGVIKGTIYYIYSIWYMLLLKISYSHIDRFLAVSNAMIPLLNNMGVPKHKIKVIYNPIEKQPKSEENIKEKLGIKNKVIIYAGRLSKEKGIENIIKAITNVDCTFIILGEKNRDYYYFKTLSNRLKVEKKVRFLGFIENREIPKYYQISDIAILCNKVYESLSKMLIEASANGLPLIATDIGGNREIVYHNINGLLLKNNEPKEIEKALRYLLENDKIRRKMGEESKKLSKKFNIEVIGKKLLEEAYYE
jgi:glycosyltransferase involved in cell wall biosynthesis